MSKIKIEGLPVAVQSDGGQYISFPVSTSGHLYLVFEDDTGSEFVVRGGPSKHSASPFGDFGNITLERGTQAHPLGVPIEFSDDRRVLRDQTGKPVKDPSGKEIPVTPASRGSREVPLNDRDAEDVWNLILQHAENIDKKGFPYKPLGFNSNATVKSLLELVDIDVSAILPDPSGIMFLPYVGIDQEFNFDFTIEGTDQDDIIRSPSGDSRQVFTGASGNDLLFGGGGNKDTAVFSDNFENYEYNISGEGDAAVITFTHTGGTQTDGTDTLIGFEFAQFADRTVPLPLTTTVDVSGDAVISLWQRTYQELALSKIFPGGTLNSSPESYENIVIPVYNTQKDAYETTEGSIRFWTVPSNDPIISLGTLTYNNSLMRGEVGWDMSYDNPAAIGSGGGTGSNLKITLDLPIQAEYSGNLYLDFPRRIRDPELFTVSFRGGSQNGVRFRSPETGKGLPIFFDLVGVRETNAPDDAPLIPYKQPVIVPDETTVEIEVFARIYATGDLFETISETSDDPLSNESEYVEAPFTGGFSAVTTTKTYSGPVEIDITGVGQAAGTSLSDGFYRFTDMTGNEITPVVANEFGLYINGEPAQNLLTAAQGIPSYSTDHSYTVMINAPGGPLTFGVGDILTADNTGFYGITINVPSGI